MNQRIKSIADAATLLFLRQGYAKTQISHIAKAVGVSVGTIYLDFTGKKEILHFILKTTIEPDFADREFKRPITDDLFPGIEHEIISLFIDKNKEFSQHLQNDAIDYSFAALISDAFDLLAKYAVGCLFIEKNYFDFGTLNEHYKQYRKEFYDTMNRYLTIFISQGIVRPVENPELIIIQIIETLSWWAMDMRYTSFVRSDIPLKTAKKICLDNILTAYGR